MKKYLVQYCVLWFKISCWTSVLFISTELTFVVNIGRIHFCVKNELLDLEFMTLWYPVTSYGKI